MNTLEQVRQYLRYGGGIYRIKVPVVLTAACVLYIIGLGVYLNHGRRAKRDLGYEAHYEQGLVGRMSHDRIHEDYSDEDYDASFQHNPRPTIRHPQALFSDESLKHSGGRYQPTWESLDRRPLPGWYDDAKFGIFIHWGVFSVPAFRSEWFWYRWKGALRPKVANFMKNNYAPNYKYSDFAQDFTATFYNATQWAEIFKAAGARYVVLTSKHHDGYTNWPSKYSFGWNSVDIGPGRDLVGELAEAVKPTGMHFGLYHSLYEWFHPLYLADKANHFKTQHFIKNKVMPSLYELVTTYKPDVVWSDGAWEAEAEYWNSKPFLAWLYNESPVKDTVVTNDRWGKGITCEHGGYFTCQDRFNPGKLQPHKWENAMTIDKESWAFRRDANLADFLSIEQIITTLVETVSCGGNLLMNVGPDADGRITPIYEERLRQIGTWLGTNGEAIYRTKPWKYQQDPSTKSVWYTSTKYSATPTVYAIILEWPKTGTVTLSAPRPSTNAHVSMLGYAKPIAKWQKLKGVGLRVALPLVMPNELPCQWAWVLKLQNFS